MGEPDRAGAPSTGVVVPATNAIIVVFKENLPPSCPPSTAIALSKQILIRLVPANPATAKDFASYAALGRTCPAGSDPCKWASCSMFLETAPRENLIGLLRLPNLRRMKFIARIAVEPSSGKAEVAQRTGHVSFWMYESYDPVDAIQTLESFP